MRGNSEFGLRSIARRDPVLLTVLLLAGGVLATLSHEQRLVVSATLRSTLLAPVFWVQDRAADVRSTRLELERLRSERDSLALRVLELRGVIAENTRLRGMVGVPERERDPFVAANLYPTGRAGEMLKRSFVLDRGTEHGVRADAAVVAPEGLVGVVRATTDRQAAGDFWTHPDFRVSVMTADGNVFGIVEPVTRVPPRMRLEGAPYQADLEPGTAVVTSGMGGVFPRGIPVGRVSRLIGAEVGWAKSYLVEPAVYPEAVREVLVLVDSATPEREVEQLAIPVSPPGTRDP